MCFNGYKSFFSASLKESMDALQTQAVELQNIHCLGEEILASCHPDSIITLKSWISVTKTRYEEVRVYMMCTSKLKFSKRDWIRD